MKSHNCIDCGTTDPELFYCRSRSVCKKCRYNRECTKAANSPDLRKRKSANSARYQQSTVKQFLTRALIRIKRWSIANPNKPSAVCSIDIEHLLELWTLQAGRCAMTGIPMTHRYNSLIAVSVDRIENDVGHITGNIQLVCKAVNLAKNKHSNTELVEFLCLLVVHFDK